MKLLVIRHGQSVGNEKQTIQGHLDYPLSKKGLEEAKALGHFLANEPICAIYSSDLLRAKQTAEAISAHHNVQLITNPLFREVRLGSFEGLTYKQIKEQYPQSMQPWLTIGIPGMESVDEMHARTIEAIDEILAHSKEQDTVVLVSHGGFINSFLMTLIGSKWQGKKRFTIKNTGISTIYLNSREDFYIESLSEIPHLVN